MSSRRTTLGPVHPNRVPSIVVAGTPSGKDRRKIKKGRASMLPRMAGGRQSLVPPSPAPSKMKANRRKSVAGDPRSRTGGNDRRKSFVPPPGPPPMTDPRPISDKSYKDACAKELFQYLRGHDVQISYRSITRPSGKDFQHIVTFMLRRIDPTFGKGDMKLEDEVAMQFKALGYPFTVSKTALVAAGSPHTWPALLAALTWLMNLLKKMEGYVPILLQQQEWDENEKRFDSLEALEQETDKAFCKYVVGAYVGFMTDNAKECERLEEEVLNTFERDHMLLEKEIERTTDLNASLAEKIGQLGQQAEDLPALEKKREVLVTQLDQYQDFVRQMDEHKADLDKKVKERTVRLESTNSELETISARVRGIKEKVASQDLSVDDVKKMKSEQNRLQESMDRVLANKQKHSKALMESEMELAKHMGELETFVSNYNAKMSGLSSFSDSLYKITLNPKKAHEVDQRMLLGVDLHSGVVPTLKTCKIDYIDRIADARRKHQELLDKLEGAEAALTEAMDMLNIIEGRKTKSGEIFRREREEQEGALEVRLREAQTAEREIASLSDPVALEEAIAECQRQSVQLEALRMKHQEENIARKKACQEEIATTMRIIAEHREHKQKKLAEWHQYIQENKASTGNVAVPSSVTLGNESLEY